MKLCDVTLPTPEENLACDEALLDLCEAGGSDELLRLWTPQQYFVVLGYADKAQTEANLHFCRTHTIPVLRRCSGGGAVLQGPGVLNYSLILRISDSGSCHSIPATNRFILQSHRDVLAGLLGAPVEWCGQTDLAIGGLKFAGNAQRRRRCFLLFHGSFLLHLDLHIVEQALPLPSRQPDYRVHRSHADFLINLNLSAATVSAALIKVWDATAPLASIPSEQITLLAREKYSLDEWNLRF